MCRQGAEVCLIACTGAGGFVHCVPFCMHFDAVLCFVVFVN